MRNKHLININVTSRIFDKQKDYWINKLSREFTMSKFPMENLFEDEKRREFESDEYLFSPDISIKLEEITDGCKYSIYIILISGLKYLLYKYSGDENIGVGIPILMQKLEGEYLNNFICLKSRVSGNMTFKEVIYKLEKTIQEANKNMAYPVETILENLDIAFGNSPDSLFGVLISFEGVSHRIMPYNEKSDVEFDFYIDSNRNLRCNIKYNSKKYTNSKMQNICKHLSNYLKTVLISPDVLISEIDVIDKEEKQFLLKEFNETIREYPSNKSLNILFEQQVEKTPDNIAVVFGEQQMTYRELNIKSNQVAEILLLNGVKEGAKVAIMMPRCIEVVVAVLGILKAKCVCVPVDHNYPEEKAKMIFVDSDTQIILKSGSTKAFDSMSIRVLDVVLKNLNIYNGGNKQLVYDSKQTAYLIYTSGSTGRPKGVELNHYGIVNHMYSKIDELHIGAKDVLCHNLSISFVASIWQMFTAFVLGCKLKIYTEETSKDSYKLFEEVALDGVSVLEVVPSLLVSYLDLLDLGQPQIKLPFLKILVLTGEKVTSRLINRFYNRYRIQLLNAYGQSECSDDTLHYKIPIDQKTEVVPIGKPANNTRVYILDVNNKLQPIGVEGELCISGDGVAKGYYNNPELTVEKFVDNPFLIGEKMFRTGDMAKWLYDGNIEYIGRRDQQVKIRGYRIELGDIESSIISHNMVSAAAVVDREEGDNKYLIAFVSMKNNEQKVDFKEYLSKKLPDYMIPSDFVGIENMPLSTNGKVNKKTLKNYKQEISFNNYVEPESDTEKKLEALWRAILNVSKVGVMDDFFELGGHSLKSTELAYSIKKEFNIEIPLKDIFTYSNIKELARYIEGTTEKNFIVVDKNLVLLARNLEKDLNLFLIHAGGGEVEGYLEFCNNLELNCWGIKVDRLRDLEPQNQTIEKIAENYIKKIKTVQQQGPYNIFGWCIGGTIAFEIVRQLEEMNDEIDFAGIINSHGPEKGLGKITDFSKDVEKNSIKQYIREFIPASEMQNILNKDKVWTAAVEYIESLENNKDLVNKIKESIPSFTQNVIPNFNGASLREVVYYGSVIRSLQNAQWKYEPYSKVKSNIYFFEASQSKIENKKRWNMYCNKKVQFVEVEGNHFSIFKDKYVKKFSEIVNEIIKENGRGDQNRN